MYLERIDFADIAIDQYRSEFAIAKKNKNLTPDLHQAFYSKLFLTLQELDIKEPKSYLQNELDKEEDIDDPSFTVLDKTKIATTLNTYYGGCYESYNIDNDVSIHIAIKKYRSKINEANQANKLTLNLHQALYSELFLTLQELDVEDPKTYLEDKFNKNENYYNLCFGVLDREGITEILNKYHGINNQSYADRIGNVQSSVSI